MYILKLKKHWISVGLFNSLRKGFKNAVLKLEIKSKLLAGFALNTYFCSANFKYIETPDYESTRISRKRNT